MITIVKGNEKIICSYRTYDEQFKQYGYVIASEPKKTTVKKAESVLKEEVKEEVKEEPKEIVADKEIINEEDKIGSKYGVRRRNTTKKEEK